MITREFKGYLTNYPYPDAVDFDPLCEIEVTVRYHHEADAYGAKVTRVWCPDLNKELNLDHVPSNIKSEYESLALDGCEQYFDELYDPRKREDYDVN